VCYSVAKAGVITQGKHTSLTVSTIVSAALCVCCVCHSVGKAGALPTKMLCDFNPRPVTKDVVEYTHR
jgi:hypothetical protein